MSEKEQKSTTQSSPYLIPLAIIVAGGLVGAGIYFGGKQPAAPGAQLPAPSEQVQGEQGEVAGEEVPQYETTVGDFLVLDDELCAEDGKPVVYFFGSSGCSHCQWEHPLVKEVAEKFGDQISFHDNMDDSEGRDMDVYGKYGDISGGYVPFIVLGCRYARLGDRQEAGGEAEKQALTELICQLTNNQPSGVCEQE